MGSYSQVRVGRSSGGRAGAGGRSSTPRSSRPPTCTAIVGGRQWRMELDRGETMEVEKRLRRGFATGSGLPMRSNPPLTKISVSLRLFENEGRSGRHRFKKWPIRLSCRTEVEAPNGSKRFQERRYFGAVRCLGWGVRRQMNDTRRAVAPSTHIARGSTHTHLAPLSLSRRLTHRTVESD